MYGVKVLVTKIKVDGATSNRHLIEEKISKSASFDATEGDYIRTLGLIYAYNFVFMVKIYIVILFPLHQ